MAVALDEELVGDLHGADLGDAADIVAAEIEQHQVLGALLRVGEQAILVGLVLVRGLAARHGAGDRADRDRAVAHAHQDLGARARDREAAEVEEEQERRRIDPAQRAVERKRRQRERRLEALREHDLKDVAGRDVFLGAGDHRLELVRRRVGGRRHGEGTGRRAGRFLVERAVERIDDRGEPLRGAAERGCRGDTRLRAAPASPR